MHDVHRWVFPDRAVSALIAIRPLSLSVLEKYEMDPFTLPTAKIGDICSEKGIAWQAFLNEMEALAVPGADSDWTRLPLYHLLDYLTNEHRVFNRDFLPAIKQELSALESGQENPGRFLALIKEWHGFAIALSEHIAEEESFLFLKILRYDYCVRHGKVDPDFFKGSVRVFAALQLHKNEQSLLEIIRNFLGIIRRSISVIGENDGLERSLMELLESFDAKHLEHSRIEKEILVPMASALEKRLYDQFISGGSGFPPGSSSPAHVTRTNEL